VVPPDAGVESSSAGPVWRSSARALPSPTRAPTRAKVRLPARARNRVLMAADRR